jgi:hypothetical protein
MSSSSTMSDPLTEDETVAIAHNIDNAPEPKESDECPKSDPPEQPATPELTSDETIPEPRTIDTAISALDPGSSNEAVVEPSTEAQSTENASRNRLHHPHRAPHNNAHHGYPTVAARHSSDISKTTRPKSSPFRTLRSLLCRPTMRQRPLPDH